MNRICGPLHLPQHAVPAGRRIRCHSTGGRSLRSELPVSVAYVRLQVALPLEQLALPLKQVVLLSASMLWALVGEPSHLEPQLLARAQPVSREIDEPRQRSHQRPQHVQADLPHFLDTVRL
jgi:hypothetical protein